MIGPLISAIRAKLVVQKQVWILVKSKSAKMTFFGQKTTNLAIFIAKSRHIGKIQHDMTYMYITTPHNAQKTLKIFILNFRGVLFSFHGIVPGTPLLLLELKMFTVK